MGISALKPLNSNFKSSLLSLPIISVEGLGKRYRLKHQAERPRYTALRDVLSDRTQSLAKRLWSITRRGQSVGRPETVTNSRSTEDFWALKDVSFEVKRGEVVGIIGRNGAGKSTLLKILSRITEPTEGRIRIRGRVASLLEVGTGFHPELTGRENIFLNGAILGMTKAEIRQKFDEIVSFAEVEKFLDTPVKRYSSGMHVRLAFAVAAHLEPEILIVDEVLAVGDAEFQRKCLGKMKDVAHGGRTVLFVSHNMTIVQNLCGRGVLLRQGIVEITGSTSEVMQAYMLHNSRNDSFVRQHNINEDRPSILSVELSQNGKLVEGDGATSLRIVIQSPKQRRVALDFRLQDHLNAPVSFGSLGTLDEAQMLDLCPGKNEFIVAFPTETLANGSYQISLDLTIPFAEFFDRVEACISFDIERPSNGFGRRQVSQGWGLGSNRLPLYLVNYKPNP